MAEKQIMCVNKEPRNDPHHRITHVGGTLPARWKMTTNEAIADIGRGHTFFTYVNGIRADVVVAVHIGHPYLKTVRDKDTPDNLLSLPECP